MLGNSLEIIKPFGRTLLLSAVFLILLLLLGESITRSSWFQSRRPIGEWGTDFRHVSEKLDQLEIYTSEHGSIDCLFLGNSMVLNGIDPDEFSSAYEAQTGQSIRCFNFGIDGMPAAGAGAFVNALVDDYRPRILFYLIDVVDFAMSPEEDYSTIITEMPWLRYRQGDFNLKGMLVEHSTLYKSQRALYQIIRLEFRKAFIDWDQWDNSGRGKRNGFIPEIIVLASVSEPPDQETRKKLEKFHYHLLKDITIYPENERGLEEVINQKNKDVEVIVVQLPVPDTYMSFFGKGMADYERFVKLVEVTTQAGQVDFIRTVPTVSVPDDAWYDYSHLNAAGAEIFSDWLGKQYGQAVVEGRERLTYSVKE